MLAKGTRIKVIAEGSTTKTWFDPTGFSPSDLHNGVMNILSKKFAGVSISIMPRSSVWIGYLSWPYRGEVQLTTTVAYAHPDDAASIVANAFYQVGGALPSVCVDGYGVCTISQKPSVDNSKVPPGGFGLDALGFGAGALVLAGIAVAVFVAKRG